MYWARMGFTDAKMGHFIVCWALFGLGRAGVARRAQRHWGLVDVAYAGRLQTFSPSTPAAAVGIKAWSVHAYLAYVCCNGGVSVSCQQ